MVIDRIRKEVSLGLAHHQPFFSMTSSPQATSLLPSNANRQTQNWVLDPVQDLLFIIAAPLICLALALVAMHYYGAAEGAALVIVAHIILTVAHHMPTFIRIYGDVDLLQRFKWSILLGPVIPLTFSIAILLFINYHEYPVEYFLYLYIFLTLWDPWHFLRQHFGFMRIYDRNNASPAKLASNMDWIICVVWFVHIMIASAEWIPGLLEDLYRSADIPALLLFPSGAMATLQTLTWWLAVLTTLVYTAYTLWCLRRGYYVSSAKLALLICTFGVMYFTYTPNDYILQLVPAWSFKVGFAVVGIVHMTQYLAIVWRYDRKIAEQGRARANWFQWLHSRNTKIGGAVAVGVYVLFCIGYGDLITSTFDNRWLMSCLLAVGFTSTLMHYYYDGFIWKMRHAQNREALGMVLPAAAPAEKTTLLSGGKHHGEESLQGDNGEAESDLTKAATSWWNNSVEMTAGKMFLRQLLYFGLPMAILTVGAMSVWQKNSTNYVQQMYRAQTFSQEGLANEAAEQAVLALSTMQSELPVSEKLAELKPNSAHEAQLAFLIYNESLYSNVVMPALDGANATADQQRNHKQNTRRAADILKSAVYRGGDLGHAGREDLTREQANSIALSWQRQVQ